MDLIIRSPLRGKVRAVSWKIFSAMNSDTRNKIRQRIRLPAKASHKDAEINPRIFSLSFFPLA